MRSSGSVWWRWLAVIFFSASACAPETYWIRHPEEAYQNRYYRWALEGYDRKWEKASEWERSEILSRAVHSALQIRDYSALLTWAERGIQQDPSYLDYHRYRIQALIGLGKISEARTAISQYLELPDASPSDIQEWIQVVRRYDEHPCPGDTSIQILPLADLNSPAPDFGITITPVGWFFSSQRKSTGAGGTRGTRQRQMLLYGADGFPYADIFRYDPETRSIEPVPWNTPFHEGAPFGLVRQDSLYLFYTYCGPDTPDIMYLAGERLRVEEGSAPLRFRCQIHLAIYLMEEGRWLEPRRFFPSDKQPVSVSFPQYFPENHRLIVAFRKPGLLPEIGITQFFAGKWEPLHAWKLFSTAGNDFSLYLWNDTLGIWSTDGRSDGYGNLDLYIVWRDREGVWHILNPGCPLNSGADEYAPVITAVESAGKGYFRISGFFTSSRKPQYSDDLYQFTLRTPLRYRVRIRVVKEDSPQVLLPARLIVMDVTRADVLGMSGDTVLDTVIQTIRQYPWVMDLKAGHRYRIVAATPGYMRNLAYVRAVPVDSQFQLVVTLDVVIPLRKIELGREYVVSNIYYEYDDYRLLPQSFPVLDTLAEILQQNPELVVEIGAHTDCRGSDYYNLVLSFKRAQSVVKYLLQKGIPASRLRVRGYGESQPVIRCEPCESCSEELHARNRRTTFRIVEVRTPHSP